MSGMVRGKYKRVKGKEIPVNTTVQRGREILVQGRVEAENGVMCVSVGLILALILIVHLFPVLC